MAVTDHWFGLTTDAANPALIWTEQQDKNHFSKEEAIDVLLADYHMISI